MSNSHIDDILNRLHTLQAELENEIDRVLTEKRERFQYTLKRGRVRFERGMRALQRHQKTAVWTYIRNARLGHLLSAPVTYSLIIPFVLLDIMVSIYQHVCFRIYGIPLVSRKKYFVVDRQHLAYLNLVEKFNCIYCGYGNSLIEYTREIAGRTEQYWCPIKHAQRTPDPHHMVDQFVDYGDADAYKNRLQTLREELDTMKNTM